MKLNNISTWMGDRLVGCASVVKHPQLAMSLTLEPMSYTLT